jgi:hypothetical protein
MIVRRPANAIPPNRVVSRQEQPRRTQVFLRDKGTRTATVVP